MSERKTKKLVIWLVVLLAFVVIEIVFQKRMTMEEVEPEFVFSYAENQPEDYPTTLGAKYFAELVETRTEGRIRIVVQAEGKMGTEAEVIRQIRYGGIDFSRVSLSQLAEYLPELNVLQMPYLYEDSVHMWKVLDGEFGGEFLGDVSNAGLIGLSWYDAGARNFYNSKHAIACLEDIEGMKIRVQESELMVDMVEALGATAVPLDYSETYSALERGIVDGAENNWPSYESMNHNEVAKYYTVDEHTRVPEMQICSEHTWEKLSAEDQTIIIECAKESALYERGLWSEREEESRGIATEQGTEVVELSVKERKRFQTAMTSVYEKYCGEYMDIIDEIIAMGEKNENHE